MRIWIIDHYSSEPKYGGIQRQFDFANELSKRGHEVVVISSAYSHFNHKYIFKDNYHFVDLNLLAHYVYVKTISYDTNRSIKRILNTLSFKKSVEQYAGKIKDRYGEPDVVVGCSVHPFSWVAAYHVARKMGARFYAEVRDLWPASWIYNKGMSPYHPKAFFFGRLQKWAFDRATKIIYSMSRGDKYICDELGYPRAKAVWIDQPMDCDLFDLNAQRYKELPEEIRSFIGDSFLCIFTGYYMEYEGVLEMLEAANILKKKSLPIKFLFLGSGQAEEKMRSFAAENRLDNVFIGGRISKELIPAVLRRADVCLAHLAVKGNKNSYKFDASKNKLNEYMYSDSCIIYGTYIEKQYVETSGAGYTIEPYKASEFAEKIEAVYLMPKEERNKFGENGRKHILQNNTVQKLIDRYLQAISD